MIGTWGRVVSGVHFVLAMLRTTTWGFLLAGFGWALVLGGCAVEGTGEEDEGSASSEVKAGSLGEGRSCGTGHKKSGVKVKPSNWLCKEGLVCRETDDEDNPSGFACQKDGSKTDARTTRETATTNDKADGERCRTGAECRSGRCDVAVTDDLILTCLPRTTPVEKKADGERCRFASECESGRCDVAITDDRIFTCLPRSSSTPRKKADGERCGDWTECDSGFCTMDDDGIRRCDSVIDI